MRLNLTVMPRKRGVAALLAFAVAATLVVFTPLSARADTVEYRVNAGGAEQSTPNPVWEEDTAVTPAPYSNISTSGQNNVFAGTPPVTTDATIPAGTPNNMFLTFRWDPTGGNGGETELEWDFPVTNGAYLVRLYFAEMDQTKNSTGARVFDVSVEGALFLDDFDVFDETGATSTGTMRATTVDVADGNIDIDFAHVVDNPIINGIEIVAVNNADVTPDPVEFGTSVSGTDTATVTVTNNTGSDLTVESTDITGTAAGDFSDDYSDTDMVLANGQSLVIEVTFNAPATDGTSNASLEVSTNVGIAPLAVSLVGEAVDVDVAPDPVAITTDISSSGSETVTVTNNGTNDVTVESTAISGADASDFEDDYSDTDTLLVSGDSLTFDVTFNAPGTAGVSNASLDVTVDGAVLSASLVGTAQAVGEGDLSVSTPVDFGYVDVGADSTIDVTVTNEGDGPATVTAASLSGVGSGSFSVDDSALPVVLAASESVDLPVTFSPTTGSLAAATLTVEADVGGDAEATVFGFGSLTDVPSDVFIDDDGSTFESEIDWLAASGITKGCNPPTNDQFCGGDFVTRGQMAAFLHRALVNGLVPGAPVEFTDDDGSTFESDIEWLGATGVTKGCNPPTNDEFCPNDFVTRGQMAAFLHRALGPYLDAGPVTDFVDDDGSTFESDIEWLGATGVTKGCNPPTNDEFCPNDFVTRGQMAAFLFRALGS